MTTPNTLEPEVQAPKDPLQDLHERGLLSSFDEGDSSLAVIASQELGRRHDEWTNTFDTAASNMMNLPRLTQTESYQSGSLFDRLAKVDRMHDYNDTLVAKPIQEEGEDDDTYTARLESQREKHKNGEVPFPLVSDSHSSRVIAQRNLDKGLVTAADKSKTAPLWSRALWGEAKDAYITFATSERTSDDMEAFGNTMDNVRGELIDGESRALLQPLLNEAPLTPATVSSNLSESLGIDFDKMDISKRNIKLSSAGKMKGSIVTRADGSVDHLNITLGDDTDINTASLNKAMHSGARVYLQTSANSDSYNDPRASALYEKQFMEDGTPFTATAHNMKKMSAAKEKQWTEGVVALMASKTPDENKSQGLLLLGATLAQITERVDRGVLSIHAGEYIAKSLYNTSIIPSDRKDPEAFKEWLSKNKTLKTRRDKLIKRFKFRTSEEKNWLIKPIQWAGNTAVDVFGKDGMDRELSELRAIDEKWVIAWASRNAGKVGVDRDNVLKAYDDSVDTMDELDVSSWDLSKEAWRGATQNAFGSTIGIFSGLAAMGGNKVGGMFSEELDDVANTIFRRNHESYKSWMKGLETNARLYFKDEGKALDKQARDAMGSIFTHIDSKGKYLSPEEEVEYARKFKELTNDFANYAHGRMAFATTADSFLNDFGNPADYDPQKNTAMAAELYGYMRTGNPAHKMRFNALSLMNPEQRKIQMDQSAFNEGLSGNGSKLFQGFFGGMTAGWQELGVETVSNLLGLKLASIAVRAKHLRQVDKAMRGGVNKSGLATNRTFRDLSRFSESAPKTYGKFRTKINTAGRMARGVVPGAVGEAFEELYVELGNPAITGESAFEAMKQGFMGGGGIGAIQVAAMTPSALAADEITENNIGILNNRQIIADRKGITAALEDAFSPLTAEAIEARAAESTDDTQTDDTEIEFLGGVIGARSKAEAEFAELSGQTGSTQSKATAAMARREDAQEALHTAQREHKEKHTAVTQARLDAAEVFAEIADAHANEMVGKHNAKGKSTSSAAGETATSKRLLFPGAPVDESTAPALTFDEANAKDAQDAAPPVAEGDPAPTPPSDPSPAPYSKEGIKQRTESELKAKEQEYKDIIRKNVTDPKGQANAKIAQRGLDGVRDEINRRAKEKTPQTLSDELADKEAAAASTGTKAPATQTAPAAPAAPARNPEAKVQFRSTQHNKGFSRGAKLSSDKITDEQLAGLEKQTETMLTRPTNAVRRAGLREQLADVKAERAHRAAQKSAPAPKKKTQSAPASEKTEKVNSLLLPTKFRTIDDTELSDQGLKDEIALAERDVIRKEGTMAGATAKLALKSLKNEQQRRLASPKATPAPTAPAETSQKKTAPPTSKAPNNPSQKAAPTPAVKTAPPTTKAPNKPSQTSSAPASKPVVYASGLNEFVAGAQAAALAKKHPNIKFTVTRNGYPDPKARDHRVIGTPKAVSEVAPEPSQTSSDTSNTNPLIGFQTHPGDNSAHKGFIAEFAAIKHRDSLTAQTGKSYQIVQKDGKYWLQETAAAVVVPGVKAGTISTGLARNKRWAKVAKNQRVQNAIQVLQSLGADIRFQRDSKSGTANATAAEMTDGSMRVTVYAHGLKQSAEEVALTLIHESKHIGQYLYERTAEGKVAAKKAEKMFVEGHAMYDQKLNDYMRKEYPKWDSRTPRSKLREATRAVLEGLESNETTGFRKGIYSHIKAFLKYINSLLEGHQTFSTYVEGVKAQLDTISKLEDTAQETATKDAAPPAKVKAPAPETTPVRPSGSTNTRADQWVGAETGKPITLVSYRGTGGTSTPLGERAPVMGPARYSSASVEYAREYGDVRRHVIHLNNPYVLTSSDAYLDLARSLVAGVSFDGITSDNAGHVAIREHLEGLGHDGVIVELPYGVDINSKGERTKFLSRIFDVSQVIEFNPGVSGVRDSAVAAPAAPSETETGPFGEPLIKEERKLDKLEEPSSSTNTPTPKLAPLPVSERRSLFERAEDSALKDSNPFTEGRVQLLKDRHQRLRNDLIEAENEGDSAEVHAITQDLIETENNLRTIVGDPLVDTSPVVTKEDQAKSDAYYAKRVKEIQAKLDAGSPITVIDRSDWLTAGQSPFVLPSALDDISDPQTEARVRAILETEARLAASESTELTEAEKAQLDKDLGNLEVKAPPKQEVVETVVDKELTDAEKQEAAGLLGEKSWTDKTRKKFTEALADWIVYGQETSAKLVSFFKRVIRNVALLATAVVSFNSASFTTDTSIEVGKVALDEGTTFYNIEPEPVGGLVLPPVDNSGADLTAESPQRVRVVDSLFLADESARSSSALPVKAPIIPEHSATDTPVVKGADFGSVVPSKDVQVFSDWVVHNKDAKGKSFVVADKVNGSMYLFSKDGVLIRQFNALFGKTTGDVIPGPSKRAGVSRVSLQKTPAGRFGNVETVASTDPLYAPAWIDFIQLGPHWKVAIHKVWNGMPAQKRSNRLKSKTPLDNRISGGCINIDESVLVDDMIPAFEGGGVVYVLPESEAGVKSFSGFEETVGKEAKGRIAPPEQTNKGGLGLLGLAAVRGKKRRRSVDGVDPSEDSVVNAEDSVSNIRTKPAAATAPVDILTQANEFFRASTQADLKNTRGLFDIDPITLQLVPAIDFDSLPALNAPEHLTERMGATLPTSEQLQEAINKFNVSNNLQEAVAILTSGETSSPSSQIPSPLESAVALKRVAALSVADVAATASSSLRDTLSEIYEIQRSLGADLSGLSPTSARVGTLSDDADTRSIFERSSSDTGALSPLNVSEYMALNATATRQITSLNEQAASLNLAFRAADSQYRSLTAPNASTESRAVMDNMEQGIADVRTFADQSIALAAPGPAPVDLAKRQTEMKSLLSSAERRISNAQAALDLIASQEAMSGEALYYSAEKTAAMRVLRDYRNLIVSQPSEAYKAVRGIFPSRDASGRKRSLSEVIGERDSFRHAAVIDVMQEQAHLRSIGLHPHLGGSNRNFARARALMEFYDNNLSPATIGHLMTGKFVTVKPNDAVLADMYGLMRKLGYTAESIFLSNDVSTVTDQDNRIDRNDPNFKLALRIFNVLRANGAVSEVNFTGVKQRAWESDFRFKQRVENESVAPRTTYADTFSPSLRKEYNENVAGRVDIGSSILLLQNEPSSSGELTINLLAPDSLTSTQKVMYNKKRRTNVQFTIGGRMATRFLWRVSDGSVAKEVKQRVAARDIAAVLTHNGNGITGAMPKRGAKHQSVQAVFDSIKGLEAASNTTVEGGLPFPAAFDSSFGANNILPQHFRWLKSMGVMFSEIQKHAELTGFDITLSPGTLYAADMQKLVANAMDWYDIVMVKQKGEFAGAAQKEWYMKQFNNVIRRVNNVSNLVSEFGKQMQNQEFTVGSKLFDSSILDEIEGKDDVVNITAVDLLHRLEDNMFKENTEYAESFNVDGTTRMDFQNKDDAERNDDMISALREFGLKKKNENGEKARARRSTMLAVLFDLNIPEAKRWAAQWRTEDGLDNALFEKLTDRVKQSEGTGRTSPEVAYLSRILRGGKLDLRAVLGRLDVAKHVSNNALNGESVEDVATRVQNNIHDRLNGDVDWFESTNDQLIQNSKNLSRSSSLYGYLGVVNTRISNILDSIGLTVEQRESAIYSGAAGLSTRDGVQKLQRMFPKLGKSAAAQLRLLLKAMHTASVYAKALEGRQATLNLALAHATGEAAQLNSPTKPMSTKEGLDELFDFIEQLPPNKLEVMPTSRGLVLGIGDMEGDLVNPSDLLASRLAVEYANVPFVFYDGTGMDKKGVDYNTSLVMTDATGAVTAILVDSSDDFFSSGFERVVDQLLLHTFDNGLGKEIAASLEEVKKSLDASLRGDLGDIYTKASNDAMVAVLKDNTKKQRGVSQEVAETLVYNDAFQKSAAEQRERVLSNAQQEAVKYLQGVRRRRTSAIGRINVPTNASKQTQGQAYVDLSDGLPLFSEMSNSEFLFRMMRDPQMMNIAQAVDVSSLAVLGLRHSTGKQFLKDADVYVESMGRHFPSGKDQQASDVVENTEVDGDAAVSSPQSFGTIFGGLSGNSLIVRDVVGSGLKAVSDGRIKNTKVANEELTVVMEGYTDARKNSSRKQGSEGVAVLVTDFEDGSARTAIRNERFQNKLNQPFTRLVDSNGNGVQYTDQMATRDAQYDAIMNKSAPLHLATGMAINADIEYGDVAYKNIVGPYGLFARQKAELTKLVAQAEALTDTLDKADELIGLGAAVDYEVRLKHATHLQALTVIEDHIGMLHESLDGMNAQLMASNAAKDATIKNYKIRQWELHKQRQRDQRKGVGEKAELVNSMLYPLSEAGAAFDNGVEAAALHFDKHIKLSAEAKQEMEEADIGTVHEEDSDGSSAPIPPTTPSTPTTITQPLSALSAPGASAGTLVLGKALQLKVLNLALASNAPFKAAYESNPNDPVVTDLMGMIASMAEMFEDTRSTQAVKNTARYTMNMFIRGNVAAAKLSGYGLMANVTSEDAARTMVNGVYSQFKRKLTDHRRSAVDTMLSQESDANEFGNDIFGRVDMGMRGNSGRSGWGREMLDFKDSLDTLSRRIIAPALTYAYVASQIGSVSGGSKLTETQQIEANLDYLEGGVNINKKWLGRKRGKVASELRSQDAPARLAIKQARAWLVKHADESDIASKLDIYMQGLMSPDQVAYIKTARDWFSAREDGLRLMHMQEGRTLGHFDRYLPVRGWDLNESQGPDVGADALQLKASNTHAKTRFNHEDQTRGLDLEPTRAILSSANSMSYQMNTNGVNTYYDHVFGTETVKSGFVKTVDKLSDLSSEEVIKLHMLNDALAVELTILKANDLNHVHHDGWFMRTLSFSGSVGFRVSLTSLQQIWLQTAPVMGAYAVRSPKKTPAVMSALARLIATSPVKGANKLVGSDISNYSQHVSDLIKHVSPQLFSRSVDGVNEMKDVLDTVSMSDLTGILDKMLNTPRAALGVVNKGYESLLSLSTAVPDSVLVRAIFAANYEISTGKPIDANSVANLDQAAARQAKDAAEGEMALSDRSTKSPLFQPQSHAGKEVARRALIVFSNHLLTLAPNARAGRAMMKSDDPVMQAEGKARVKDFVVQTMLFNLLKVKNLAFLIGWVASRGYDDEKDRDRALAANQKMALDWWADHTFSNYRVPMDGSDFMASYFLKSGLELTGLASPWLAVAQINNLVSLFAKAGIEAYTGTDIAGVPSGGMAIFQEMVGLAGAPGFAANSIIDAEEMFRTSRYDYELTWDEVGLLALTFGGPRESRTRMLKQVGKNTGALNKEGFKSRGKQTFYRNLPSMLRFHPDPTQPEGVAYTAPTEAQWESARVEKVDPSWTMERVWSNPNRPSLDDGDSGRLRTGMFTYFDWRSSGSDTPETKSETGQQWKQSYDQGRIYGLSVEETNKYGKAAAYNMFKNLRSGGTVYVAHQDKSVHGGHRTYAHVLIERNGNLYNLSTLQVATGHARVNRNIARDYRNEDGTVERGLDGQPVRESLNKLYTIQEGSRRRGDGVWAKNRR